MTVLMLKKKQMGFPALAKPEAIGDGDPAYGCRLIIDPEDRDVKVIDKAIREVAVAKWKDKADDVLEMLKEDKKIAFQKYPYRSSKTGKVYDGFEGTYNLGCRTPENKGRPTCIDLHGAEITDPSKIAAILYSGCIVHAKVEIWAQDNSFGRRINCSLLGVMYAGKGTNFGGGSPVAAPEDFAEFAEDVSDALGGESAGEDLV